MYGVIESGGQCHDLGELASSGRAASNGAWSKIALPPDARARIHLGDMTFDVASVPRGKATATRSDADRPFWIYNGASVAALGSLLVMLHLMPDDGLDLALEDTASDNRFVGFMNQPDQTQQQPVSEDTAVDEAKAEAGGQGQRHHDEEGRMGDPRERASRGVYAMKNRAVPPTLARNFDPELAAKKAGILGQIELAQAHFFADAAGSAFASGLDEEDVWGSLHGTEVGTAYGVAGLGLVGTGRGGGSAEGIIGLGRVGLIGKGSGGGRGIGTGRGDDYGNARHGPRRAKAPRVHVAKASSCGGCGDKGIIRRVVRSHINEVRHCYNQGLVRDPNLRGRVSVQFTIGPVGKVVLAAPVESTLDDATVGRCVAKAVQRWNFPRPPSGGRALVTYPFVFEPG
jgi:TonB family protein